MGKINRSNIGEHLMDYQLRMLGKTRIDMMDDDRWYFNWTMTRAQKEEFHKYAIPLLQKTFRFNRTKAEETFNWFWTTFGVRLKG